MSEDRPDRPPTARFLAALEVRRNAAIGVATGVGFATAVYLFFVGLGPAPARNPVLYVGLAVVLATAVAGVVAVALTIRSAIRLSRRLPDETDSADAEGEPSGGEGDPPASDAETRS